MSLATLDAGRVKTLKIALHVTLLEIIQTIVNVTLDIMKNNLIKKGSVKPVLIIA